MSTNKQAIDSDRQHPGISPRATRSRGRQGRDSDHSDGFKRRLVEPSAANEIRFQSSFSQAHALATNQVPAAKMLLVMGAYRFQKGGPKWPSLSRGEVSAEVAENGPGPRVSRIRCIAWIVLDDHDMLDVA